MQGKTVFAVACVLLVSFAYGNNKLHGVTHSPLSMDRNNLCIDTNVLLGNLEMISTFAKNFRVYAIGACQKNTKAMLDFAREKNMGVMLGLWISGDTALNKLEMQALKKYAGEYQDVIEAVVVGNEPIFVLKLKVKKLLKYMKMARKTLKRLKVDLPVTTAEVWPVFQFNTTIGEQLADASDFICMQMQPFWEGLSVRCADDKKPTENCVDAGTQVENKAQELEKMYKKDVVICETGWPTFGESCCEDRPFSVDGHRAHPSVENSQKFLDDLVAATAKSGRPYYLHEALDADWKRIWVPCTECTGLTPDFGCDPKRPQTGCEVDYHFGLYSADRKPKGITIPKTPSKKAAAKSNSSKLKAKALKKKKAIQSKQEKISSN